MRLIYYSTNRGPCQTFFAGTAVFVCSTIIHLGQRNKKRLRDTTSCAKVICSTDSISFWIDFLSEKMDSDLLPTPLGQRQKSVLSNGQHASRTAGSVITGIGSVLDLVCDRHKHKVSHILPISQGGTHDASNLMSLCQSCHTKIHHELGDR